MGRSARANILQAMYDWTSRMLGAAGEVLIALKGIVEVELSYFLSCG